MPKAEPKEETKQKGNDQTPKLHPRVEEANELRKKFSAIEDIPVAPQQNYRGKFLPMQETEPMERCTPGLLRSMANSISGYAWDALGALFKAGYWTILSPFEWMSRTFAPIRGDPVNADGTPTRVAVIGAG